MDLQKVEDMVYDLINSGELHSTIIGKQIMVNHSDSEVDKTEIREFAQYISHLIWRAKDFDDRKHDNVKKK